MVPLLSLVVSLCISSSFFFFSSRRRHTRSDRDWSSDVCSSDLFGVRPSGSLHPRGRRPIAQSEARASAHRRIAELANQVVGTVGFADDVVADGDCEWRLFVEREAVVKGRDAIGLGRRNVQPAARVLETPAADPADLVLERVQHGQQQVAPRTRRVAPAREVIVSRCPLAALPQRGRWSEDAVDSGDFSLGRWPAAGSNIHYAILSTRMALALNSAVPDLGSVASMVSTLVATWSGKCSVMKARPGRSVASKLTGTSTDPRRELAFTRSPSAIPKRAPSAGESRRASPLRSGDV